MEFLKDLKEFFNGKLDYTKPILLAFSGGLDSSCLLDLLLKFKQNHDIDLHVAHIDHGWREESSFQALEIKRRMKELKIPVHLKRLNLDFKKNLENESRNQRLLFFKSLFKKYKFQALITAHQKDDLAETVLKRFLEGSNIFSLTSMQKVSKFDGLTVFRPLLNVLKKDILSYLHQNNVKYYKDFTNEDTKFLRAKMRVDVFPFLQKNFNKRIIENLSQMSSYSSELYNYLESKTKKNFKKMKISPFGLCIDLNGCDQTLELKFIIKKIASLKNIDISRDVLEKLIFWILQKRPNLKVNLKNAHLFADRGHFFVLNDLLDHKNLSKKDLINDKSIRESKVFEFGNFDMKVTKIENEVLEEKTYFQSYWKDIFLNKLCIYLPENKYHISFGQNKYLKKLWENSKVPAFLRKRFPIIYNSENQTTYDFLSGKTFKLKNKIIYKFVINLK